MSFGGGGFHPIGWVVGLGKSVIANIAAFAIGGLILVVGGVALMFFIPMKIQGNKDGIQTANNFGSTANVAIGAAGEFVKTSHYDRAYGAELQRKASAAHLKKIKAATP